MDIKEVKHSFSNEELQQIKEVSDDIFEKLESPNNKIITKNFVFEIFLALIISIPLPNIFDFFLEHIDNNEEKWLLNLYNDLLNLQKINFFSKDLKKRIFSKHEYYEKVFKIRVKIQNFEFNYHNLGGSTANFLRAREILNIEFNHINKNKLGNIKCLNCNTKWLFSETDKCPTCEKENDLEMYIIISNFFKVVGDMTKFYEVLDPKTMDTLCDNWIYIQNYFKT